MREVFRLNEQFRGSIEPYTDVVLDTLETRAGLTDGGRARGPLSTRRGREEKASVSPIPHYG